MRVGPTLDDREAVREGSARRLLVEGRDVEDLEAIGILDVARVELEAADALRLEPRVERRVRVVPFARVFPVVPTW